jgi:transketolase
VESAIAWQQALSSDSPSALIFSRQNTQPQPRSDAAFANIEKGGYVVKDSAAAADVILIATGSEVETAVAAADALAEDGVNARVVSMPCAERFLAQDADYRESVLPAVQRSRVAVEAAHPDYWYRFVGLDGAVIGIDRYGISAPGGQALAELGITAEAVAAAARALVN